MVAIAFGLVGREPGIVDRSMGLAGSSPVFDDCINVPAMLFVGGGECLVDRLKLLRTERIPDEL